ncbi:hypothetical protein Srubr_18160 [Streptomyces rubradiris]|uniref:Ketosynthase family 3 (KS3) domain-containing protein n=1 Tax=Streptomyces rubradiris TaxID=285531 RepID=A0ABQ3R7Z0_STRRR|nr:hypothetical protein Srubr_18160 [Streptomyces rubradiris]
MATSPPTGGPRGVLRRGGRQAGQSTPGRRVPRHIDLFDHDFFGISRREALAMDPAQRLSLQVCWERWRTRASALGLAGSRTVCSWCRLLGLHHRAAAPPRGRQRLHQLRRRPSFVPARIAYLLDLRGPNLTIDSACSASLLAVHQACQSLRLGECDMALAGGVNVVRHRC